MSRRAKRKSRAAEPTAEIPKVSHDVNSKRRHIRLHMPLKVTIDGVVHSVCDWSLGGMQIEDIDGLPGVGGRFSADLAVPFNDFSFTLTTTCEVAWLDLNGRRVGCRFIDLKDGQIEILRYLVDAFIAGKVANVSGVLRLAAKGQATPIDAGVTPHLDPATPRHVRTVRALRRTAFVGAMAAAGILLSVLVANTLISRFLDVSSDLGWVHARTVDVQTSASGVVAGHVVDAGETVRAGQPLFEILDPEIEGQLDVAIAELGEREEAVAGLKRQLDARRAFFDEYVELAGVEERRAVARVKRAELNLSVARDKLERATILHGKGFLADRALEDEENRHSQARLERQLAEADLSEARRNRRLAEMGYIYPQRRVEGDEPAEVARRIRLAEKAVDVARARIDALLDRQEQTVVRSPCDCLIEERIVIEGEWLPRGAVAFRLSEAGGPRVVKALVPQESVGKLTIGHEARVALADRDEILTGRIVNVDRTPAADSGPVGIVRLGSRYGLAEVTVNLDGLETAHAGLPARLVFPADLATLLPFPLDRPTTTAARSNDRADGDQLGGLGALAEAARTVLSLASR